MDLAAGDSILVRDYLNNPDVTFFAFGNTYQSTGNFFVNATSAMITFKSNTDGLTGRGFNILLKRLYTVNTLGSGIGLCRQSPILRCH